MRPPIASQIQVLRGLLPWMCAPRKLGHSRGTQNRSSAAGSRVNEIPSVCRNVGRGIPSRGYRRTCSARHRRLRSFHTLRISGIGCGQHEVQSSSRPPWSPSDAPGQSRLEIIAAMHAVAFLSASSPRYTPPRGREHRRALTGLAELANYDLALRRQVSISLTTTAELVGME